MKARHILSIIILTLMGVVSVSAPVMAANEPREASLEFVFNSAITMTLSEGDITITDLEIGEAGLSNEIDILIETSNAAGYELTATTGNAENSTRNLVLDANNYFASIDTNTSVSTLSDNTWGFTTDGGATFSGLALYTDNIPTLLNSSRTPVSGDAGKTSFAIGVKSSSSQASGAYTNVISFTAVPTVYIPDTIITFNANGGTGTMENQTLAGDTGGALTTNTFTRDGYAFTGWNTKADGSGTPYSNGATYTGPSTTLYAQWQKLPIISELTYMQDFAGLSDAAKTNVINSMTQDIAYELQDNRDGTTYHISKLADDKIWLLDNLALDLTNSTVLNNMTPENTNASTTSLTSLKSGNRSAGDQYATAGVSNWTSDYSNSAPLVNMTNKDVIPNGAPTNSKGNNKIGGYYNFCAASAGSYCYGNGTSGGTSSGNATEDICPAGWRLPTGSATGEYSALANAIYGSTGSTSDTTKVANFRTALSLPLSGYFNYGSANYQGDLGNFWSSTRNDNDGMYFLNVGAGEVRPVGSYYRRGGLSVRCLAK